MALASLLLQRHYICLSTRKEWKSVEIRRTPNGKPFFENLQYNVSHAGGLVVLVGFHHPIGVDIVRRDELISDFSSSDLTSMFSPEEREYLSKCSTSNEYNDLFLVNLAFKEAYMKFTGTPDWDNLSSIEFLDITIPWSGLCTTTAVGRITISGVAELGYTECHLIERTHFIALYTSSPPDNSNTHFTKITLKDFVASMSIEDR